MAPRFRIPTALVVGALGIAAVLLGVAACSGNPSIRLETAGTRTSTAPPTVTVSVTTTVTGAPVTTTLMTTVSVPPPITALPTSPVLPSIFDEEAARSTTVALIADIGRIDRQFAQPATPPSGLTDLDAHLARLLAAGVPTGADGPSYVARVLSLRVFASAALGEAGTNRSRAISRYGVVRQETGVLLGQLNLALRAAYVLPPPPNPTTATPAP